MQVPDGVFQRPSKLNCVEVAFKRAIAKMGRHYIPGRAGVTTDGVLNNKYRARCRGRGRCGRGCDIGSRRSIRRPRSIYPARDTGNLTVRPYSRGHPKCSLDAATNRATGVRVIDANTREVMDFKARAVVLGAGTLETHAHPAQLAIAARIRTGLGNSSGLLGCYLSEHIMGIRGSGYIPARIGTETTLDDGRPVGPYIPRFRNVTDQASGLHPRLPLPGRRRLRRVSRHGRTRSRAIGKAFKSNVRKHYPAHHQLRRLRRGAAAQGEPRHARSRGEGRVGRAGAPVRLPLRRQRAEDGQGHGATRIEEMLIAAGAEDIKIGREPLPPGWSIHEIGTARMGDDPKTSVTDRFCRLHDVKNVYLADAAPFVSRRHAEHDVDDSRDGVAHHGLPERRQHGDVTDAV